MRLKYYLRGAGVGMLITAIILAVALKAFGYGKIESDNAIADESILGDRLEAGLDTQTESDDGVDSVDSASQIITESGNTYSNKDNTEIVENEINPEPDNEEPDVTDSSTQEPDTTGSDDLDSPSEVQSEDAANDVQTETKKFVINGGQYSEQVSRNLESEGLIDDATKFNEYICGTGYDNYLQPGNYEIPVGATYEEIAKILTKK